jgi:hypothetical protein
MNLPTVHKYERLKLKKCKYPECNQLFNGTGFSKYCAEHRKKEYRKILDKLNKKVVIIENANQYYEHELIKPATISFNCALCKAAFDIKIYPNVFVYPKFCESHRNEYKRKLWLKMNNNIYVPEIKEKIENELDLDSDTFIDYVDDFALIENQMSVVTS